MTLDLQRMINLLEDRVKKIELTGGSTVPVDDDEEEEEDFELFGSEDEVSVMYGIVILYLKNHR